MRILQIVEPGSDGVFRHVEGLIDFLIQEGHSVHLAFSDIRGSDRLYHLVDRVEKAGGGTLNMKVSNLPQPRDIKALFGLSRFIKETRPQVVHAHSSKAGALLRLMATPKRLPVFYTPNAYFGMGRRGGVKESIFNIAERLLGNVGTTINVSADEAEFGRHVLGVPAAKQVIIPNAVDVELFRPGNSEERVKWRAEHNLPPDAVILGTVGRLSYQKNPLNFYRAFHRVVVENSKLYFAHVGAGDLTSQCVALIKELKIEDRVIRIEYTSNPAGFYGILDGFVLPSRYEGLSFAVLEALAADLPLILTDVPGNRDFFNLGLSHLTTCVSDNEAALSRAMIDWYIDFKTGRDCNHREIAGKMFSFEICYGKIINLYEAARIEVS